jgi:hypothetical protein
VDIEDSDSRSTSKTRVGQKLDADCADLIRGIGQHSHLGIHPGRDSVSEAIHPDKFLARCAASTF